MTEQQIVDLLNRSDEMVRRSLKVIFSFQTVSEQDCENTMVLNGCGFSGADAAFGSSLAKQVIKKNFLSVKQLKFARRMCIKYRRQLTDYANSLKEAKAKREEQISSE